MAILLIRIDNTASLPLNEFYDYNGHVYALSRRRDSSEPICIDFEDFYEASIGVTALSDVPIVFVTKEAESLRVCGWYTKAEILSTGLCPTFFLEGNIIASSSDAYLLPLASSAAPSDVVSFAEKDLNRTGWLVNSLHYEVVEAEDFRYASLKHMICSYHGQNAFLRYAYQSAALDPAAKRSYALCIDHCRELASMIMEDQCRDIRDIKLLESYAKQASSMNSKDPDGFYYLAMASYQLGFVRQGMKAIEKALKLEPAAADLIAQKAFLLISMGYTQEATRTFQEAYLRSGEEDYLLWEGKAYLLAGDPESGYDTFRRITNQTLLKDAGIDPQDLEKKSSFLHFRGFRLGSLFRNREKKQ